MSQQHTLTIRVNYHETDGQGRVHHANYLNYFERGRVELMRSLGSSYKQFEADGLMLVVAEMNVKYHQMAEFDDELTLTTTVLEAHGARIRHRYEIFRDDQLLVFAESVIACVRSDGRATRLPAELQQGRRRS
ncbi:acyl-CoA thioesterase [Rosistilla oblonga]|uniref:acyl-CoA thioesterase n=1 Tax=Rosistilla oblonga TaxID=2527990 RepID=UPI003A985FAF